MSDLLHPALGTSVVQGVASAWLPEACSQARAGGGTFRSVRGTPIETGPIDELIEMKLFVFRHRRFEMPTPALSVAEMFSAPSTHGSSS